MATLVRPVPIDNCQQPVLAYPHDRQMQEIVSRGIQKNRKLTFKIQLEGWQFHDLLRLLEQMGIASESPITMRECVRVSDKIMEQLRAQGFYKHRKLIFNIKLQGWQFYDLLQLLDQMGIESESPITMRECVHVSDKIMEQLRAQGFYG